MQQILGKNTPQHAPAGQDKGGFAPPRQNKPPGHEVNCPALSVGTCEPGGALVHVKEPAAANVPALHTVNWVELEHANPAGHVVHILVT